jgi:outer membrane protein insertion porin family
LGGKKRNSLTVGFNSSSSSNAIDPYTGRIDRKKSDTNYLRPAVFHRARKAIKWPDDYFSLVYTLNFTQYKLRNYPIFDANFTSGVSNNVSAKITLMRSSIDNPLYSEREVLRFTASVQFTPPYSLFNRNIVNLYKQVQEPRVS